MITALFRAFASLRTCLLLLTAILGMILFRGFGFQHLLHSVYFLSLLVLLMWNLVFCLLVSWTQNRRSLSFYGMHASQLMLLAGAFLTAAGKSQNFQAVVHLGTTLVFSSFAVFLVFLFWNTFLKRRAFESSRGDHAGS